MDDHAVIKSDFNEISELGELKWNHNRAAHHLSYEWLLCFAKDKLKKSCRLIILDIAKADEHSKEIWERHGMHDKYMTIKEIKSFESIINQFNYIPESSVMCSETRP